MSVRHWGEFSRGEWLVNISYTPKTHKRGYVLLQTLELGLFESRSQSRLFQRVVISNALERVEGKAPSSAMCAGP